MVPSRRTAAIRLIAAVTGPLINAALNALPSDCAIDSEGIVMVASEPVIVGAPGPLFARMTPMAPAFCAFLTGVVNPHPPASIKAILPAMGVAMAEQPSAGDVSVTEPLILKAAGPNPATP